jgi:hypothetical protein
LVGGPQGWPSAALVAVWAGAGALIVIITGKASAAGAYFSNILRRDTEGKPTTDPALDELKALKLPQCQPHNVNIDWPAEPLLQQAGHFSHGGLSISSLPNHRRSLVKAMGLILILIIDQGLVIQLLDDETIHARTWHHDSVFYLRATSSLQLRTTPLTPVWENKSIVRRRNRRCRHS